MTDWRYCGRFNSWTQDAMSGSTFTWMDETEAKRRYPLPDQDLTVIPPTDPDTGIIPYFIVISTGPYPHFVVVHQTPAGLIDSELWWHNMHDGQLFCDTTTVFDWPPEEPIIQRSLAKWSISMTLQNTPEGTGTLITNFYKERRRDIEPLTELPVKDLYRPVPEWGHWQELVDHAPDTPERLRHLIRQRHPEIPS